MTEWPGDGIEGRREERTEGGGEEKEESLRVGEKWVSSWVAMVMRMSLLRSPTVPSPRVNIFYDRSN